MRSSTEREETEHEARGGDGGAGGGEPGPAGAGPGAARADNSPFGDLLTTINTLGPEVAALQALAPSCTPVDPCVPVGGVTLINAGTLAGFNLGSFNNTVYHNASSILALRGALGALYTPLSFCGDLTCSESLAGYLQDQGVDLATVVAAVGTPPSPITPPNPIRIYFYPGDPCVPQLTAAACRGRRPRPSAGRPQAPRRHRPGPSRSGSNSQTAQSRRRRP